MIALIAVSSFINVLPQTFASDGEDTEISVASCQSKYGTAANSCNQCFENTIYNGHYRALYDTYTNSSPTQYKVMYTSGDFRGLNISYNILQSSASFVVYPSGSLQIDTAVPDGIFSFDSIVPSLISPTR